MKLHKNPAALLFMVIILSFVAYAMNYRSNANRRVCQINMNSFEKASAALQGCHMREFESCGTNDNKLKYHLHKTARYEFPSCPSGGSYTIHYDGPHGTPYITCSCAESHDHTMPRPHMKASPLK